MAALVGRPGPVRDPLLRPRRHATDLAEAGGGAHEACAGHPAVVERERERNQAYLGDLRIAFHGSQQERGGRLAMLLLMWAVAGAAMSWPKGARVRQVQWIGVQVLWSWGGSDFFIPRGKTQELAEELSALIAGPVAKLADLRRVTGRNSWATSLLHHARWAVARPWAVLADKECSVAMTRTRGQPGGVPVWGPPWTPWSTRSG